METAGCPLASQDSDVKACGAPKDCGTEACPKESGEKACCGSDKCKEAKAGSPVEKTSCSAGDAVPCSAEKPAECSSEQADGCGQESI
jgi:hypothetical protein